MQSYAILKHKPTSKSFKTLMTSFKIRLCVYTPSNAIDDASMIDFGSQNGPGKLQHGPKIVPTWSKMVPTWSQDGLKTH